MVAAEAASVAVTAAGLSSYCSAAAAALAAAAMMAAEAALALVADAAAFGLSSCFAAAAAMALVAAAARNAKNLLPDCDKHRLSNQKGIALTYTDSVCSLQMSWEGLSAYEALFFCFEGSLTLPLYETAPLSRRYDGRGRRNETPFAPMPAAQCRV